MANKNIPTAAATKARSSSVPKTPPRSRGRSVAPRATSCTPKKGGVPDEVDIDSITSSMNSMDITSKDVRNAWIPEVDVDAENPPVPVYDLAEGIEQKDTESTCIHNTLPQVDGDAGAKFEVGCVSVTHTLTQQEMCDDALDASAHLIKSLDGETGVCFTLQTDKTRLAEDHLAVAGVKSMLVSEKGMADSDPKKEQSGFNARTTSFLNSFLKHSAKLENEEKVKSSRQVIYMLPTVDSNGVELVDDENRYYGNLFLNNDGNNRAPGDHSLKCSVEFIPGTFTTADGETYHMTTAYAIANVAIVGSQEWTNTGQDDVAVNHKAAKEARKKAAARAKKLFDDSENESTPNHTAAPQEEEEEGSLSTIVEEDEEAPAPPAPPAGNTNPSTKKSSGGTKSSLKSDTSSADDSGASKGCVTFVFGESQTTSSDSTATPKSKSVKQRVAEFEASQAKNNTTKDAAPDDPLDGPCDLHDPPSQDTKVEHPTSPKKGKPRQDFKVQSRKSASAKTSAAKQAALKSLSDEKKETKIVKGREKATAELGITGHFIQTRRARKEQKEKELRDKKEQEEMKGAFLKELESKVQVEELD